MKRMLKIYFDQPGGEENFVEVPVDANHIDRFCGNAVNRGFVRVKFEDTTQEMVVPWHRVLRIDVSVIT